MQNKRIICVLFSILAVAINCYSEVLTGIDVLQRSNFDILQNKRVGLLTHNAAINKAGKRTLDVLIDNKKVNLTAIFAPEHGLGCNAKAGHKILDEIEPRSKLPIFSLYGDTRIPTDKMLANIDIFVIDLQDIGTRSYTYASCMRYSVEACLSKKIPVVILDRPNPLGGVVRGGPPMDNENMSYVGAFNVPYVHGLTIGELALSFIKQKSIHSATKHLAVDFNLANVNVIKMEGWSRSMTWTETALKWVSPSPNVPSLSSAFGYAFSGIATVKGPIKIGINTPYKFRLLATSKLELSKKLHNILTINMPSGMSFKWIETKQFHGSYTSIDNWNKCNPSEIILHIMNCAIKLSQKNCFKKLDSLDKKIIGDSEFIKHLEKNNNIDKNYFLKKWNNTTKNLEKTFVFLY